ncbi:Metal-binding protein ZinT precursor [Labrenzia sp. THAF191b]|uniref:ZinT family metal-binding protein n=1 Tax=unclassified Labrenzia TaxID=2648686 RepID=UPI001268D60A|nr:MULTISPECIES: metal-binding protein ZinT [unclassified Labrenzia]QFS96408.1 Metal-binding protein ZinT precursor [Labrenzia sp. THAF191b]QFT02723.1 Metal-binding protein ZinT precursor [Labrenzia sp. THAF191a]QFT14265.1 Metal-binding protein ZinT precursor [Labrenzia sp. THAF187b]
MQSRFGRLAGACALIASLLVAAPIQAQEAKGNSAKHDHSHKHSHDHSSDAERQIYKGYFEDSQIQPRPLTDWQGEWQSVYPYLQDGTLDPVMAHKAEHGSKSAEEYKSYYETGYRTDVDRIVIGADSVTFQTEDGAFEGQYIADGFEILNYKKGNRGVRFIFRKTAGDDNAPAFIQFSDHRIAPSKSDHYHLYWGEDRQEILKELTNWPTYYPAALNGDEIVHEMTAH